MMKLSTTLFPEKKEFHKINDAAIGWAHRKRKASHRLETLDTIRFHGNTGSIKDTGSPTASQKKAVRLMINEPDGGYRIEEASPVSQSRKRILIKNKSLDGGDDTGENNENDSFSTKSKKLAIK